MADAAPIVDPRRASRLRDALLRNARMLAPDWAGVAQEGDFGRGLLEIAARLAEHSTIGLDQTPLRDKLAFLDALDVPGPAPRSATAPIVFTLAEKRDTKVSAPARVQLSAKSGKEDLTFETLDAIDLTPARIANLIVADPAADRIECAPAYVTRSVDAVPPATAYLLLSAVEANATTLQLVQGVGIMPGDLLRLAGGVYRVAKAKNAIVELQDALGQSAPAGAVVEKLIALESFALRNLQDHAVYFGHKAMLKLDGTAAITLVFDPPTLPAVLARLNVDYEIWGTRDGLDEEAGWRPLELLGAGPTGLVLGKAWSGSVDELALAAGKSRWLRIRIRDPIAGVCGPPTGAVSVELKVRSTTPKAEVEGSKTIAAAFYNSQPLPTATAFFPFGPEPQRFDIFSLSAPEALSKKGAHVTLNVRMVGADLQAMTYVANTQTGPAHVYGVSSTGRMQSVYYDSPAGTWRQIGVVPSPGVPGEMRFDPWMPPVAIRLASRIEFVFVRDAQKRLLAGRVEKTGATDWSLKSWTAIDSPQPKEELLAMGLLPPVPDTAIHWLLTAYKSGVYAYAIDVSGTLDTIRYLGPNPAAAAPIAITLAHADSVTGDVVLALIDGQGLIRRGDYAPDATIQWREFGQSLKADAEIQPAAFLDGAGKLVVVAARKDAQPGEDVLLVAHEDGSEWDSPNAGLDDEHAIGQMVSIQGISMVEDGPPLVFVSGDKQVLTWLVTEPTNPPQFFAKIEQLPAGVDGKAAHALVIPPASGTPLPRVLLNAGAEQLMNGPLLPGVIDAQARLRDVLRQVGSARPTHMLRQGAQVAEPLAGPWVKLSSQNEMVHAAPAGFADGARYTLLEEGRKNLAGAAVAGQNRKLELAASDQDDQELQATQEHDFLLIAGQFYEIVDIPPGSPRIAELDADLAGTTTYSVYRTTDARTFDAATDTARLVEIAGDAPTASQLLFDPSADPRRQDVDGREAPTGATWFALGAAWDHQPAGPSPYAVALLGDIGLGELDPIVLPRNADNPALSWEYHNGEGWRRLDKWGFADTTGNLAGSGDVSFIVPDDISPTEIAGKEDFWIRARLTGGDFGRAAYVVTNDPPSGDPKRTSITIDRSELNPPEIYGIEASYVLDDAVAPDLVVADNNLAAIDQTQAALAKGAIFNLFEGVAQHVHDAGGGTRALYIGLDKRPDVQALRLFADIRDRDDDRRELIAEVWTTTGWQRLGIDDSTAGLARPGMIQLHLVPPPDHLPLFGRDGWWLRLRPETDAAAWAPDLRALFVNAVMATHAKTVLKELLGSSLGDPDQLYQLAQAPVLPDTLDLRVFESLGEEERKAIVVASGSDAIAEDRERPGYWVRWRSVATFVDADGDARVFRLDPLTGQVQFGNGRRGKTPPAARDSICAFAYQCGGGSTGNVAAGAIAQLSSTLESVELAMNPVAAGGGADALSIDRIAVVAPGLVRHMGRALTPIDIEAIATASAPDVVRARCLPGRGCGIELVVAIRDSGQHCPMPSRERREGIARQIRDAGWGALAPDAVIVRTPYFLRARVEAEVVASGADGVSGVEQAVRARLAAFLHPVDGGPDGLGWPFGRRIWPSDLQRAVADIAGLDRIVAIGIEAVAPGESLAAMPLHGLICVEDADLAVIVRSPEVAR